MMFNPASVLAERSTRLACGLLLSLVLFTLPQCGTPGSRIHDPLPPAEALERVLDNLADAEADEENVEPHLTALSDLVVQYPRDVEILFANAIHSFQRGAFVVSREYTDRIFRIERSHPKAAILRVRLALKEGNSGFARRFLKEQILLRPDDPELHETMACVHFLDGNAEKARESIRKADQLGSPAWRLDYHRGVIYESERETERAIRAYASALEANPNHVASKQRYKGITGEDWTRSSGTAARE